MELKSKETEKVENRINIKYLPISELRPYLRNPRKNDKAVKVVEKSIKEFKFRNPIILDKNNEIVAGHTRLKAAIKLGYKELPTIQINDLTDEQIKAFRIMDNKSSESSSWDWDLLKLEFEDMKELEFTGFTEAEIEKVMDFKDMSTQGKKEPKYEIKLGDIYQLGNHKIICADSTKEETYLKLIPNEVDIQMIFTDPPYGVSYSGISNQGRKSPERGNIKEWDVIEGDEIRGDEFYELIKE